MTDLFFGLVSAYGLVIVGLCAYVSCLAVPVPTFAVMLAGGAFAATGDFVLWQVWAVAYVAAVCGDQTGFQIGRAGGARVLGYIGRRPRWQEMILRAQNYLLHWGGLGVFLSTWLVAPLGPWVNLIAGAAGLHPLRFLVWDAAGEAIWVTTYIMLGYMFGDQLDMLADLVSNYAAAVTAAVLTLGFGALLIRQVRKSRANKSQTEKSRRRDKDAA